MSNDNRTPRKRTPKKGVQVESDSEDEEMNDFGEEGGQRIGDIYIPPPPPAPKYSGDATGERLIITYIENIDFKSYAGRQILGPFHKSFTSIVGPNGSGKSNVIDSMLFVFGYRAQKLRSKKLSVLIHNSDTFPNVQSCEVIVHFALINDKGGDDFEIIPNSEFKVSRSVSKDNNAFYTINGRRAQFKEVSQLLQSYGIDLRYNRFLILQGEVEQIALMKPKADNEGDTGMLEFLEDIIGCSRLKAPLLKLQEKVEEKSVLRAEKLNRVKVVEKEKDALLEARNEAVHFLETENRLTKKKNEFYHLQRAEAVEVRNEALAEYEKANELYREATSKIEEIKKAKSDKEEEAKACHDKLTDISKSCEEYNGAFKDAEKRDTEVRSKIKHTKTKGKKMTDDLSNEKKRLEDLMKIPDKCSKEQEELAKRKEQLEEDKGKASEHLSHVMGLIKEDTAQFQQQKDEFETQLLCVQKGVNESRSKHELADSELELYLNKERSEKAKLEQFKLKFERNNEDAKEKEATLKNLKQHIPSTEERLKEIKSELSQVQQQKNKISHEIRSNMEKLEDARNVMNSHTSRNAVVNALMEQKRLGKIKGILGRLGDLGAIDQKYDVAISTACGALDNIVTDTMENAQQCVRFLKASNIGATTFIALDKMRRWESNCHSHIETPENVPRLFDLVRVTDDNVLPAFYYALRDTLVAENLTQATRVGLGGRRRWRVVTLKGELVEISGAMSGGGRPSSGKMGSSISGAGVSEGEIQEMEGTVNALKAQFNELKTKEDFLNAESDKLHKDVDKMKQSYPKYELEISEFKKQQSELKKSIDEQEVRVKEAAPDPTRVNEMEKKVKTLKSVYDKKAEESKEIELKIKELNGKIAEIMEKKVGSAKREVERLNQDIEKVTTAITKATVSQKTALRNIEKSKSKIETMEKELEDSETLIVQLKEEMKKIESEAAEVTVKYEECCNKRDEIQKKYKEIQSAVNSLKEKESRLNSDNLDTKLEVDKLEKILKEKEAEVTKWHNHIKSLQLQEIDGQEPTDGLLDLSTTDLQSLNSHSVQKEIEALDKELKKMKPNMAAIAEYRKKEAMYLERAKELDAATKERDMYKNQFEQLRAQRHNEFKDGYTLITRKLKEMYRTITLGGDAELEWADSLNPFSEGINFTVRPNKKSWKKITNLSGGEKTLSSLALIFALHYYKPSPLYVMDEIDAALDFRNVSIVAHYIKQRTQNTQFIIISLRPNMYELANRLVGIYKTFNCTKSVTFNPSTESKKKTVGCTDESETQKGLEVQSSSRIEQNRTEKVHAAKITTTTIELAFEDE